MAVIIGLLRNEANYFLYTSLMVALGFTGIFFLIITVSPKKIKNQKSDRNIKTDSISNITYGWSLPKKTIDNQSDQIFNITKRFFQYLRECEENSICWNIGIIGKMASGKSYYAARIISEIKRINPNKEVFVLSKSAFFLNADLFENAHPIESISQIMPNSILLIESSQLILIDIKEFEHLSEQNISTIFISQSSPTIEIQKLINIYLIKSSDSSNYGITNPITNKIIFGISKLRTNEAIAIGFGNVKVGFIKLNDTDANEFPKWDNSPSFENNHIINN